MKPIIRNTRIVSISLPPKIAQKLETVRQLRGQSRSAFIAYLIKKEAENQHWQNIYKKGQQTAKAFNITSEEDIDQIIHAS